MLTKWRQAIEAQLDVELLRAMGGLRVKGDENTPPMKAVSTATQLCLFPRVIECDSSFCLPGRQTEIPKEKEDQEK